MEIDKQSGWLTPVTQLVSPNRDERPDSEDICGIVIHNISLPPGEFGGPWIADLFLNRLDASAHPYFAEIAGLRVSSHLLIRRDGEIQQFVPFQKRAWHAGMAAKVVMILLSALNWKAMIFPRSVTSNISN